LPSPSWARGPEDGEIAPPIAPAWHTGALVALIVLVAVTGTLIGGATPPGGAPLPGGRIVSVYLPMLLVQWGLAVYVCRVGRPRNVARALLGRSWDSPRRAISDILAACALAAVIELGEWACVLVLGAPAHPRSLAPAGIAEQLVWIAVAGSTALSEELVYRGYLRTQFTAFTRSATAGVVIQALLFGMAHLDQGPAVVPRFAVYAILFALLASSRQSLWAGIICHGAIDLLSGFVRS
jgi:membrane protease YdiL (CAAX protease family)